MDLEGATGTLYEGEKFQLQFKFGAKYPFDSPQVSIPVDSVVLNTPLILLRQIPLLTDS